MKVSVAQEIADKFGMANGPAVHDVLVANTVYTATLDKAYALVRVTFRHATGTAGQEIYFTTDGSTPTVKGTNCHVCDCVQGESITVQAPVEVDPSTETATATAVKLISTLAADFSVEGVQ